MAELAHGEKSHTQSQSITHPAYLMPREPKFALRKKAFKIEMHCITGHKVIYHREECIKGEK